MFYSSSEKRYNKVKLIATSIEYRTTIAITAYSNSSTKTKAIAIARLNCMLVSFLSGSGIAHVQSQPSYSNARNRKIFGNSGQLENQPRASFLVGISDRDRHPANRPTAVCARKHQPYNGLGKGRPRRYQRQGALAEKPQYLMHLVAIPSHTGIPWP